MGARVPDSPPSAGTSPPGADPDALKAYRRMKLAVVDELRALRAVLDRRGSEGRSADCRDLMAKLAEDRFTLTVVGQFARGKSSLMNAIVGRALLPTGLLPLTSAITVLRFGPQERLVVEHEGVRFPEVVPISRLDAYVTQHGNPGNRKNVTAAYVEAPCPRSSSWSTRPISSPSTNGRRCSSSSLGRFGTAWATTASASFRSPAAPGWPRNMTATNGLIAAAASRRWRTR
jgi:hypothetical protein